MSTRVVLARTRRFGATSGQPSLDGPPEVHAYRVTAEEAAAASNPDEDTSAAPGSVWEAVCGHTLARHDAEIVERYTGAPCMSCFMTAIMASDIPPLSHTDAQAPPALPAAAPVIELEPAPPSPSTLTVSAPKPVYALSLRERVIHLAIPDSPSTEMDGATLVIGQCGAIGWLDTKAPESWEFCPQCTEASS